MQGRTKSPSYQSVNPELYAEEKNLLVQTNSPTNVSAFTCPDCKKGFADSRTMQRHSIIHRGLRPFSCQDCGKAFMLRGDLTRHLLIHSGKRPFACNICERRFTLKGNLMQHIRTHTPEKQFTCTLCRKSFSQRESLYRHIRAHFGEKPYSCETCGKSFSLRGDLTRHIMIHTGQRPHLCPICNRSFALKGNMMQHMRTHTNCVELMTLREAGEERPNTILNFEEHALLNENSADKQIWQVTETPSSNSEEQGQTSVNEPQIDIHIHYPPKECSSDNRNVNHTCTPSTNSSQPTDDISRRPPNCELCTKAGASQVHDTSRLTYMSPVRPFNITTTNTQEPCTNQSWSQHSVACSLCGKLFKNRRYLKLHIERHKLAHTDFTCTRCRKSFLSKSEHFFHSCKGTLAPAPGNNDANLKPEPCNIVPPHQIQNATSHSGT